MSDGLTSIYTISQSLLVTFGRRVVLPINKPTI